jgi:hypothetical protein
MRNTFKALLVVMIIGLFIIRPASSYAYNHAGGSYGHYGGHGHYGGGHGHYYGYHAYSYIDVNLSIWPDSYYYGAPYYPPADEVLVFSPVTTTSTPGVGVTDSFTVNIPNDKGGYTAVTLKKSGNGYIGPQGEFYPKFPKVSLLKVIYGK